MRFGGARRRTRSGERADGGDAMTARQLLVATAGLDCEQDRRELQAAAKAVDRYLAKGGGAVFFATEDPCPYDLLDKLAEQATTDGWSAQAFEDLLDKFDGILGDCSDGVDRAKFASDAALHRYQPVLQMAYWFGLAMGLKLAGGAQ
jgi:hypothetical protein